MQAWEAIGNKLLNTTAITDIVGDRVYHGHIVPENIQFPIINFFQLPGDAFVRDTKGHIENPTFQISIRGEDLNQIMDLARTTMELFQDFQGRVNSSFDINITNITGFGGVLWEQEGSIYHIPIDVKIVFENSTAN